MTTIAAPTTTQDPRLIQLRELQKQQQQPLLPGADFLPDRPDQPAVPPIGPTAAAPIPPAAPTQPPSAPAPTAGPPPPGAFDFTPGGIEPSTFGLPGGGSTFDPRGIETRTMPLGAAPGPPPTQPFGPGANLIGQQINPEPLNFSPESERARTLTMQSLENLSGAPSRREIALDVLRNFDAEQGDVRTRGIRDIGRGAAKFGRLGSGAVTTDLGNLEERLDENRNRLLRGLSADTAGAELGDLLGRLGATAGVGGQFRSEDLGAAGFRQGLRGELRGERGFQRGLAQDAQQSNIQRALAEAGLDDQAARRELALNQFLGGIGFGGQQFDPATAALAGQFSDQAGGTVASLAQLLQQLQQLRNRR